jgi:hypothetical protein
MSASDHLHDQAIKAFNQYMKVWEFEDFWTRSNTFTAALQFVTAARTRWPNDDKIRASISQIERVQAGRASRGRRSWRRSCGQKLSAEMAE